jgi:hypothetical protein
LVYIGRAGGARGKGAKLGVSGDQRQRDMGAANLELERSTA